MTLHKVELELALELLSPLHIGTGYGLAGYLDARVLTDEDGYPYVPGSSLKGRLRNYLARLGAWDKDKEINLHQECAARVEQAVADFQRVPPPGADAMFDHLYAALPEAMEPQRAMARRLAAPAADGTRHG